MIEIRWERPLMRISNDKHPCTANATSDSGDNPLRRNSNPYMDNDFLYMQPN